MVFTIFFGAENMHLVMMQTFCAKCFQIQLKQSKRLIVMTETGGCECESVVPFENDNGSQTILCCGCYGVMEALVLPSIHDLEKPFAKDIQQFFRTHHPAVRILSTA